MNDAAVLIQECRGLGAILIPLGNRLKVQAPEPLPDDLVAALRAKKAQVLAELRGEHGQALECWVLEEWRRVSIPAWRRILSESIEKKDGKREEYARWMLREVLLDPKYRETES